MLATLGLAMTIPALLGATSGLPDWRVFIASAAFTLFVSGVLIVAHWGPLNNLTARHAFMLTTLSWVVLVAFAALPFLFSSVQLSYTNAFFEAMSGLTTTGSTVLTNLDESSPSILLWRALLQWIGGIGIIVTAIAILPMLRVGGMQLFRTESSDTSEKILPRLTQIAASIAGLYVGLTSLCAASYWLVGMTPFDSIAHAMTTIATGGFSTSDESFAYWKNPMIDVVAVTFMIAGSLPFVLYLQLLRGHGNPLLNDTQVRWFFGLVLFVVAVLWMHQYTVGLNEFWPALQYAAFNGVSILTGTGFATTSYDEWSGFSLMVFFFLMFIGGCAGSTSCGVKIFRVAIAAKSVWLYARRAVNPNRILLAHYNGQPLGDSIIAPVMIFLLFYILCFAVVAVILSLMGLDGLTAVSSSATAISNVGPGLGPVVGPEGSFANLPDGAKWVLAFTMLVGRLEVFTVLVLFTPVLWRS